MIKNGKNVSVPSPRGNGSANCMSIPDAMRYAVSPPIGAVATIPLVRGESKPVAMPTPQTWREPLGNDLDLGVNPIEERAASEAGSFRGLRQRRADEERAKDLARCAKQEVVEPDAKPIETGPVGSGNYVVAQGECLSNIAAKTNHVLDTIWNHAGNLELKEIRQDHNVLLPGDRLTVPPIRLKHEPGETERRHRFQLLGEPVVLRLRILFDDRPIAHAHYCLSIDGCVDRSGITDAEGRLEEPVPTLATRGLLHLYDDDTLYSYELKFACLNPATEKSGVAQRLQNLGFLSESSNAADDQSIAAASRRFQAAHGLEIGCNTAPATALIRDEHGS